MEGDLSIIEICMTYRQEVIGGGQIRILYLSCLSELDRYEFSFSVFVCLFACLLLSVYIYQSVINFSQSFNHLGSQSISQPASRSVSQSLIQSASQFLCMWSWKINRVFMHVHQSLRLIDRDR